MKGSIKLSFKRNILTLKVLRMDFHSYISYDLFQWVFLKNTQKLLNSTAIKYLKKCAEMMLVLMFYSGIVNAM